MAAGSLTLLPNAVSLTTIGSEKCCSRNRRTRKAAARRRANDRKRPYCCGTFA